MTHHPLHHARAVEAPHSTVTEWVNIALIAIAVASLLSYVIAANGLAAQAWRLSDAQSGLATMLEARNGLVAQQSAFEDRDVLTTLAVQAGMVPAGTVAYVVQDQPFAAR